MYYIDDAISASDSFDGLMKTLECPFKGYTNASIIKKAQKSHLFGDNVDFLGYNISDAGITTLTSYITVIIQTKPPSTITLAKYILGKINYYKQLIPK